MYMEKDQKEFKKYSEISIYQELYIIFQITCTYLSIDSPSV